MSCDSRRQTSLKRHVTFKDFTLLVIFYPLSQQHNRRCQSHVVYVYQLLYFFMVMSHK